MTFYRFGILIVTLCIIVLGCMAAPCRETKLVTDFGRRYEKTRYPSQNGMTEIRRDGARYLRVRLSVTDATKGGWTVTVRDRRLHPVEMYNAADFDKHVVWTDRIAGDRIFLDVDNADQANSAGLQSDIEIMMPEFTAAPYYSIKGIKPDYKQLYVTISDAMNVRLGDSVGLLIAADKTAAWSCSGFLVAPELFLTNWHCGGSGEDVANYWTTAMLDGMLIDLSWDDDERSSEFIATKVEAQSRELDFALLRVRPTRSDPVLRVMALDARTLRRAVPSISMIHHPEGKRKHVSVNCPLIDMEWKSWRSNTKTEFTHRCDTDAGSSGAPIYNLEGDVIGLHHLGYENRHDGHCDNLNKAIWIGEIVAAIRAQAPNEAKVLRVIE